MHPFYSPLTLMKIDVYKRQAYEAATADLNDVNMIDPFHLEAYGETTVNYNRDVEIFPVLNAIFEGDVYKRQTLTWSQGERSTGRTIASVPSGRGPGISCKSLALPTVNRAQAFPGFSPFF